ncbi:MAG: hypothetical protein AVDCRST_MAG10-935 [uncultured Acidimicrobiales bacterium]|uniref:Alcohol dehydrogenase-like N-terminal domain-containing protein n=1 Tax=uncultured Acidimicrobiales bacterium TaxID=310071 RepID=A0A6J4HM19_9ACTN|nr:MAG: hypothetical protein AVDCRST_MAG10-935 [uncultured Acidimicrobiales bacterium]
MPGADDVLVDVHAASMNAADWQLVRGGPSIARLKFGLCRPSFGNPGSDLAGTVPAVGRNVTTFQVGDAVFGTSFLQSLRRRGHRRLQRPEPGAGPRPRRRPRRRLHDHRLHGRGSRFDVILQAAGPHSPGACRRALVPGALVQISGDSSNRWIGPIGRMVAAAALSPFVSQRLTSFTVQPNQRDLALLADLVERGQVAPCSTGPSPSGGRRRHPPRRG